MACILKQKSFAPASLGIDIGKETFLNPNG